MLFLRVLLDKNLIISTFVVRRPKYELHAVLSIITSEQLTFF